MSDPTHAENPAETELIEMKNMTPVLELEHVSRVYASDGPGVTVLDDVSLSIGAGELVAIIGPSGSGKSTLMNILGCLDRPSAGRFRVDGQDVASLSPDALAKFRREKFGFIFQRYNLLTTLDALGNVEMPAIYADAPAEARHTRATALLTRLGLAERTGHTPNQLSGGQQQRVSIARALMNGGDIILADEPTGALDQSSGRDVLDILKELNQQGHTVILVTHDPTVAAHAHRIIEIRDGRIERDRQQPPQGEVLKVSGFTARVATVQTGTSAQLSRFAEALRMAMRSMRAHGLRSMLTMLGIIIGIASVVSAVGLGEGSKRSILEEISAMGTNTIEVLPGAGFGDMLAGSVETLTAADAEAIAGLSQVDSATPTTTGTALIRSGGQEVNASLNGVGDQFFRVRGISMQQGGGFSADALAGLAQEAVIDANAWHTLFPDRRLAVGEIILVGAVPVRIVGITAADRGTLPNSTVEVWIPYTTMIGRFGRAKISSLTVRLREGAVSSDVERSVSQLLVQRHGVEDFFLISSDALRKTIEETSQTITLLIASIACISLLVGGIGVMNIMLVSVTERIHEIGIRMAVGARPRDILMQFLIESIIVCLAGGMAGLLLSFLLAGGVSLVGLGITMVITPWAVAGAFGISFMIGVGFGYLPARNASRLEPVQALASA